MIQALRRAVRFLRSAVFATSLLAVAAAWSALGSLVPQGSATTSAVSTWAAAHPGVEPVVAFFGLHQAYGAPVFVACVLLLAVSTALCAWERTRAAAGKAKLLRAARVAGITDLATVHDFVLPCASASDASAALDTASGTLAALGVRTSEDEGVLRAVSSPFSVWGSPVFHWSLLALILALIIGNLARAEGLMGLAVGQTKPDAPASYGLISAGLMHDWSAVHRSLRVDAFDPAYTSDGILRGPTPTVSLLDGTGAVIVQQKVYPNHTLKYGSLTIYPSDYGLAAKFSLVSTSGVSEGSLDMLVDFSTATTSGTSPIDSLDISDRAGKLLYRAYVTVPLDTSAGAFVRRVPAEPRAELEFTGVSGAGTLVHPMKVGDTIVFPTAGTLRLDSIGYYARLQVVDDWSIPLLYAALALAMLGLTLAVIARQQIVLVALIDGEDGPLLAVRLRLWRNAASSRAEIESELRAALGCAGPETPEEKDVT